MSQPFTHLLSTESPNTFSELTTVYPGPCLSGTSSLMGDIHSFLLFNKSMLSTFYEQGTALSIKKTTVRKNKKEENLFSYCKDQQTMASRQNPAAHLFL